MCTRDLLEPNGESDYVMKSDGGIAQSWSPN